MAGNYSIGNCLNRGFLCFDLCIAIAYLRTKMGVCACYFGEFEAFCCFLSPLDAVFEWECPGIYYFYSIKGTANVSSEATFKVNIGMTRNGYSAGFVNTIDSFDCAKALRDKFLDI